MDCENELKEKHKNNAAIRIDLIVFIKQSKIKTMKYRLLIFEHFGISKLS